MTDIVELSDALVERLLPVLTPLAAGWHVEWFKPEPPFELPTLCVEADSPNFVDHLQTPPLWRLRLTFYLSAIDQEKSRRDMAGMFDKFGPIISALQSTDIDDALWRLAPFTVVATTGKGWDLSREKRNTYLEADLGVQIGAD